MDSACSHVFVRDVGGEDGADSVMGVEPGEVGAEEQAVSWLADQSWSSVEKSDILTLTELRLKPTYQWTDALTNEVNYRSNRKAPR